MSKYDILVELAITISDLPEDMQGRIFQAAFRYLEKGDEPMLQSAEKAVFSGFQWRFDAVLAKNRRLSEARRAAGKLGGRPRKGTGAGKGGGSEKAIGFESEKQLLFEAESNCFCGQKANGFPSRALLSPVVDNINNIQDGDIGKDSEIEIRGCGGKEEEEREGKKAIGFSAQKQLLSDAEDMEERYARRYHEENDWATVAMLSHLGIDQLKALFSEFMLEQKHNMVTHQDYSDFKTHFLNYARRKAEILRQKTKQQQQSNGNQQTCDRRRAAEVNDNIDYSEDF